MSMKARLEKLEGGDRDGRCVVIWKHHDETTESAMTRWKAANPNEPDPDKAGLRVYLIRWDAPSAEGVAA